MSSPKQSFQKISILLLEDSMDLRDQVSRVLESAGMGFTVEALPGSVGLGKKLLSGMYDALLIDFDLAVGDPASVLKMAKGLDVYLPVVFLSRDFSETVYREFGNIGADSYVPLAGVSLKMLPNTLLKVIEDLSFVRDATEFRRRSALKSYQIEILSSLVRKMVETNDLRSVMQELAEQVVKKLNMKVVSLQRYFERRRGFAVYGIYPQGKLVKFAQMFFGISLDSFVFPFDPENCIVDQYTAARKPWVGTDFADVFGTTMPAQAARMIQKFAGVKSIYNAPFYSKDQLLGGIVVGNIRESFTDEELEAFDAIVQTSSLLFEYNEGVKSQTVQDRKLQAIRETSLRLHENLDPERLFDIIEAKLSTIVPAEVTRLFVYEVAKNALVERKMRARGGQRPAFMVSEIPLGTGLIGRAAFSKESVLENQAHLNPLSTYASGRPEIENLLAVPILHQGELLGMITLTRLMDEPFVESDRDALEIFASQFAVALHNSGLYQDLLRSEKLYRLVLENVNDPVIFVGVDGKLLYVNHKFEEVSGYSSKEVIGREFGFLVHPDDLDFVRNRYKERISGKETPPRYEFRILRKSGEVRTVDYNVTTISEEGRITGLLGVARDVTNDRIASEELKRKTQQLQRMLDFIASLMPSTNVNELLRNLLAGVKEEIPEADAGSILTFDEAENRLRMSAAIGYPEEMRRGFVLDPQEGWGGKAFTSGKSIIVEDSTEYPGQQETENLPGGMKIQSAVAVPLLAEGQTLGVISLDSFSRKRAFGQEHLQLLEGFAHQAALVLKKEQMHSEIRESELRYRTITESSSDLIVITDDGGNIQFCNDKFSRTFALSPTFASGKKITDFFENGSLDILLPSGQMPDTERKRRVKGLVDGVQHHFEVVSTTINTNSGTSRRILFLKDISDIVRTSEWVERAYEIALEHAGVELFQGYADLLADVFGADLVYIGDYDNKDDFSLAHVARIGGSYVHTLKVDGVRELLKNDSTSLSYLDNVFGSEKSLKAYHTTSIQVGSETVGIMLIAGGKITGSTRQQMNILQLVQQRLAFEYEREKSNAETLKLEEQLRHSQKMESLGTLAGGVAHDFNNILGAILGYTGLLKLDLRDNKKLLRYLDTIEKSAQRAAELTKQLLGFARKGKTSVISIDFNRICRETVEMTKKMIEKNIDVAMDLHENLPTTEGDESQLSQALMNLILNARDAMPRGGRLALSTAMVEAADAVNSPLNLENRAYIIVQVSDSGQGISKENLSRIFEPFFTTKPKGKGTGLGLSMVYGIVKNHGGEIKVDSEVGRGTVVRVYLPVSPGPFSTGTSTDLSDAAGVVNEKVCLVIDDEIEIRDLLRDALGRFGFHVITAGSGEEAVQLLESGHSVDVVLLDMIMPGLDGMQTYFEIRRLRPTLPVLVATGYSSEGKVQEILNNGGAGVLHKPFSLRELQTQIVDRFRK